MANLTLKSPFRDHAIATSCGVANEIGSTKMLDTFQLFGLGSKTGLELPSESAGFIPGSRYWRQELRPGAKVTPSITGMMSIGQSDSAASPLQLAALVSAIANNGRYYKPRIIKRVVHPHQGTLLHNRPVLKTNLLKQGVKEKAPGAYPPRNVACR